jgi:hypothetical protein
MMRGGYLLPVTGSMRGVWRAPKLQGRCSGWYFGLFVTGMCGVLQQTACNPLGAFRQNGNFAAQRARNCKTCEITSRVIEQVYFSFSALMILYPIIINNKNRIPLIII